MKIQVNRKNQAVVFDWPFDRITDEQLRLLTIHLDASVTSEDPHEDLPLELVGLRAVAAFYIV